MKRRHFNIALASAGECAAALDLVELETDGTGTPSGTVEAAREDLEAIGALTVGTASPRDSVSRSHAAEARRRS